MAGSEGFWRWFDRGARADFAGTMLGWVFDWKGWIAGFFAGGGGGMTFLKAAIDGRSVLDVWVLAVVVAAALAVAVYFGILILERTLGRKAGEPGSRHEAGETAAGEFSGDIPDVRVADDPVVGALFVAPQHDKLLPLLERGKIDAWGRLGNGRPPLTIIPADQWKTHYLVNMPADGPGRINQTFFRPKARPYESTYYDVHLNRSQVERAWPGLWSNDRVPCSELIRLATNEGWDFTSPHSVHLIDLQEAVRQAGIDTALTIWGRESKWTAESLMRSEVLAKIPPEHWKNHFVHLFAAFEGDNFDTYSWSPDDPKQFGRRGYVDLHVSRSQATSWLRGDALAFRGKNKAR